MSSAILTYDRQTKRHEVKLVRLVARIMALASSILASCEVADYTVCLRVGRPRRIHNTVEWRLARDAIQHCLYRLANKQSHAHTVVRKCCKDDQQSQWEMLKFDPQLSLNLVRDRHQIWHA